MLSALSTPCRVMLTTTVRSPAVRLAVQHGAIKQPSNSLTYTFNNVSAPARFNQVRLFTRSNGNTARFSVKERAKPVDTTGADVNTMHNTGMMIVGATGIAGIGALCYYGLGMTYGDSNIERSFYWPDYVRQRIQSTYGHLAAGMGVSVGAAVATLRSPEMMRFFSSGSLPVAIGSFIALAATGMITMNMRYEPGFGPKHLAWIGHNALMGVVLAPLYILGGPVIIRAATYTAGIVGGLSAIAMCAPSEKFLQATGPLSIGLGVVVASSISSMFLPPTTRFGLGLYGISLYGGLVLFSGFLLYDTQKLIKKAELHPAYSMQPYDPINNSLHLYMDIVNIFVRMVQIFAMGGGGKRK